MSKLSLIPEKQQYFYAQYHNIKQNAVESTSSILRFSNHNLREHITNELSHDNASGNGNHGLMGNPVFEVLFPWEAQEKTMSEFGDSLLHPKVANMLVDSIPTPYKHQAESWEILNQKDHINSLIVTSGTGSGKTECFMVPILDDLVKQQEIEKDALTGVRALFLYPLNALINSQRERLSEWADALGVDTPNNKIRFSLYNGDTPENPKKGERKDTAEVLSRKHLRENPPPILVTNATMLEYMLIRQKDAPIIDQSKGKLRWIVLDEAHSYTGSTAAEMSLLLRRVMIAFDVNPNEVHFIATSATIGEHKEAKDNLKKFLASLAGVDTQQIHIVSAKRNVPDIPSVNNQPLNQVKSLENLAQIGAEELVSPERFQALVNHPFAQKIRQQFVRPSDNGVVTRIQSLKELNEFLKYDINTLLINSDKKISNIDYLLNWLDVCSNTKHKDNAPAFLPLRSHFFQRTLSGLYACVNPNCSGKHNTPISGIKDNGQPTWEFGYVYTNQQTSCSHCQYPVFELSYCDDCQTPHLLVQKGMVTVGDSHKTKWIQFNRLKDDDFTLNRSSTLDEDEPIDERAENEDNANDFQPMLLLPIWSSKHNLVKKVSDNELSYLYPSTLDLDGVEYTTKSDNRVEIIVKNETAQLPPLNYCYFCDNSSPKKPVIRTARLGAPFYMSAAAPILLEHCPIFEKDTDSKPAQGRRMITFTDSRQGTARITMKLRQDSERRSLRHIVYYNLAQRFDSSQGLNSKELAELNSLKFQYEALQNDSSASPMFKELLEDKITDYENKSKIQPPALKWEEVIQSIADHPEFKFLSKSISKVADINHIYDDFQKAELLLLNEIAYRPKNANSLETMGLISFNYPQLDKVNIDKFTEWTNLGFSSDDWKDFLNLILTYYIREQRILDLSENKINSLSTRFFKIKQLVKPNSELNLNKRDSKTTREWAQINTDAPNNSIRVIRLLALAANLDLAEAYNQDLINTILMRAWKDLIRVGLLTAKPIDGGIQVYQLNFNNTSLSIPLKVWVCPVTNRLLPKTFKGITPYIPRYSKIKELVDKKEKYLCRHEEIEIFIPSPGEPRFKREAEQWLQSNKTIQRLRKENLWSDISSDVIRGVNTIVTEEHSAQLSSTYLKEYEKRFKEGEINILNCSTTMEMGVDIGGISSVAMSNVPPHPANYLQRTGRAGRSRESTATAFTLCKDNPHEQMVFNNTLWAFNTQISPPYITLESDRIVQRHINAYLLASYLPELLAENESALTLNSGFFFFNWKDTRFKDIEALVKFSIKAALDPDADSHKIKNNLLVNEINELLQVNFESESDLYKNLYCNLFESSPAYIFIEKLQRLIQVDRKSEYRQSIQHKIDTIRKASSLEGISLTQIIQKSILDLVKAQSYLVNRVARRIEEYHTFSDSKSSYLSKLIFDIRSIVCGYLLSDLARHNFLPRYGFPSGLVEFDIYSLYAENSDKSDSKKKNSVNTVDVSLSSRIDNLSTHANKPVRDIAIAIREYAPGNEIAVDGLVYQSAGLELSRYYSTGGNDAQIINLFARCKNCGAMDVYPSSKHITCSSCGTTIRNGSPENQNSLSHEEDTLKKLNHDVVTYVEPMGFRVDYYTAPHNSIEHQSFVPVEDPKIQAKGSLHPLISPNIGSFRTDEDGLVFHQSSGIYGHGYFICLGCGRAESSRFDRLKNYDNWNDQRTNFLKHLPMKPISKGHISKEELKAGACDPEEKGFLVQNLFIGAQDRTNVFEMYLKDPKTDQFLNKEEDKVIIQTLSVAFRNALASCHGINAEELGFGIKQVEVDKEIAYAISIYDKASGGAGFSSTAHQYLHKLFEHAESVLSCVDECDTACHSCLLSYDTRFISHKLNRIKALEYLKSIKNLLELPEYAKALLPAATYCGQDIDDRVAHYFLRGYKQLRLYLQGNPSDWNLSESLFDKVAHWDYNGNEVLIAINGKSINNLDDISKLQLMALNAFSKVKLMTYNNDDLFLSNNYLLQMINAETCTDLITLATTDKNTYVPNTDFWQMESDVIVVESKVPELLSTKILDLDRLKPNEDNDTRKIEIYNELNGPIKEFGSKFWQAMREYKNLDIQLSNKVGIEKIEYSDRYLVTPLATLLIGEIIHGIKSMYDKDNDWTDPKVIIKTTEASNNRDSFMIDHNWKSCSDQEKVQNNFLEKLGLDANIGLYDKKKLNHRRHLKVFWVDSSVTVIVLDQGVGFLQIPTSYKFDFNSSPQAQASNLLHISQLSVPLEAEEGKIHYAYIEHIPTN